VKLSSGPGDAMGTKCAVVGGSEDEAIASSGSGSSGRFSLMFGDGRRAKLEYSKDVKLTE
jgi:hypothetical protein